MHAIVRAKKIVKKSFATRIKEARTKLGLSQQRAAQAWGFACPTLICWEQGTRNPAGLYAKKLERVLKRIEAA